MSGHAHGVNLERVNGWALVLLALSAIGICFGDIGTSPLYAMKEAMEHVPPTHDNVIAVTSFFLWLLLIIVFYWYGRRLMDVHYRGEGGITALLALGEGVMPVGLVLLGVFGVSQIFGDGFITPAISVLSAIEGVRIVFGVSQQVVVVITCVILFGLFSIQRFGTGRIGFLVGPIMLIYFSTIGTYGTGSWMQTPEILKAFNPMYAINFLRYNDPEVIRHALGGVILAITGGEAMYADRQHFGAKAIRLAWYFAMPCLMLNYLGQGAAILRDPAAIDEPFWAIVPDGWGFQYYTLGVNTLATVFASQALISALMGLSNRLKGLLFLPSYQVKLPSREQEGQVYMPYVKNALMIGSIALVIRFQTSKGLASAYGISVLSDMVAEAIMAGFIMYVVQRLPLIKVLPLVSGILVILGGLLVANLTKFWSGGFLPVIFGCVMTGGMIWYRRHAMNMTARKRNGVGLRMSKYWNNGMYAVIFSDGNWPSTRRQALYARKAKLPFVIVTVASEETHPDLQQTAEKLRCRGYKPARLIMCDGVPVGLAPYDEATCIINVIKSPVGDIEERALEFLGHFRKVVSGIINVVLSQTIVEGSRAGLIHHQHGYRIQMEVERHHGSVVTIVPLRMHAVNDTYILEEDEPIKEESIIE